MYGFLLLLENLEVLNRYFEASKPIVYHFRGERTSLSTRLKAPFHAKDRGKNGTFQHFLSPSSVLLLSFKRISHYHSSDYRNPSIFAYLQPTANKNEKCPFYRGTLLELFKR